MAGGRQERVDPVAIVTEQIVPAKPAVVLGMADHGLDGRSSLEFAFHLGRETALPSGEHDPGRPLVVVALVALVGVGAFDRDAAHGFGLVDGGLQGVAVVRVPLEGLGGQEKALPVGRRDPHLAAEFVALVGLAFCDADNFGSMQAVELVLVRGLLGKQPLDQSQ